MVDRAGTYSAEMSSQGKENRSSIEGRKEQGQQVWIKGITKAIGRLSCKKAKLKEVAHFMWDIFIHRISHEGLIGKHSC